MLDKMLRECKMDVCDLQVTPVNGFSVHIEFKTYSEQFIKYLSVNDMKHHLEAEGYIVEKKK